MPPEEKTNANTKRIETTRKTLSEKTLPDFYSHMPDFRFSGLRIQRIPKFFYP